MPRFFKRLDKLPFNEVEMLIHCRLFKFPQMDFETAVWEMTQLLIAPKKVFKSIYYQKRTLILLSHGRY